ncbi:hypothetical protein BPOR_0485g00070 [Botrytis porri]|uniref:Uncharacterized protein n=1 Tax=Botrytis porri TaxID=87229 RepID=A0A4Z1KRI8_9HELO|nr:hypothetical protein BPOR_0485g00070 [Botrytis porri]
MDRFHTPSLTSSQWVYGRYFEAGKSRIEWAGTTGRYFGYDERPGRKPCLDKNTCSKYYSRKDPHHVTFADAVQTERKVARKLTALDSEVFEFENRRRLELNPESPLP